MNYKHTQIGYLIMTVSVPVIAMFIFVTIQASFNPYIIIIMTISLIALTSLSSLKITVNKEHLNVVFGHGIIKKSFYLKILHQ